MTPLRPIPWRNSVFANEQNFPEALASYDEALAIKPNFAEAFNNRGVALRELKRFDEALASYDKAIALKPDYVEAPPPALLVRRSP